MEAHADWDDGDGPVAFACLRPWGLLAVGDGSVSCGLCGLQAGCRERRPGSRYVGPCGGAEADRGTWGRQVLTTDSRCLSQSLGVFSLLATHFMTSECLQPTA